MKTQWLRFSVPGAPQGKMRSRSTKSGHHFTPAKQVNYEGLVALSFENAIGDSWVPWEKACTIDVTAYYPIPKSTSIVKRSKMILNEIPVTKKPDLDNVLKSICDGLNGIAWHDDACVTEIVARKRFSETPKVDVVIYFVE